MRLQLPLALALALALAACGGSTDSLPDGSGSTDGSTDGGVDAPVDATSDRDADAACTTLPFGAKRACVPGTGRADAALTIAYDGDGCLGCFTTVDPCAVSVDGDRILITTTATTCPPPGDVACPAVCMAPLGSCTLPPLAAGSYVVELAGEGARPGFGPRRLVVAADGTDTACTLPPPGLGPDPLDDGAYARGCSTDDDCVIARTGDLCRPCGCPNSAIAKDARPAYEADHRARASQCAVGDPNLVCAGCPPAHARCEHADGGAAGTCKLELGF